MVFQSDYWHSLDQKKREDWGDIKLSPEQIGISHGMGDVVQGLKTNIFRGAKNVELGFMGVGKGFRSQPSGATPESFGKTEREQIRMMAKINEVELSTHASPQIGYASGLSERGFDPSQRQKVLDEVKRTVDFAADTAQGGAVVMHMGEFQRPIFEAGKEFVGYPEEKEKAPLMFVNKENGQIQPLPRDQKVSVPVGGIDNPKVDPKTGMIEWTEKTVAELEQEAIKKNKDPVNYILTEVLSADVEYNEGSAKSSFHRLLREREQHEYIKKHIEDIDKLQEKDPAAAEYHAIKTVEEFRDAPLRGTEKYKDFLENPIKYLKNTEERVQRDIKNSEEVARSFQKRALETKRRIETSAPILDYASEKAADTISNAAMYTFEVSKSRKLEKPLFVAPENWTPELFGSHPREFKKIILDSRGAMQEKLKQRGYSQEEAKRISEKHIKGTLDIGHANFWRRFYKGEPNKTPEQNEKGFRDWLLKETKELVKDKVIGHVHLSDNFGYYDEHLEIGEGNAPVQEFMKQLAEAGYEGSLIGEPGGQAEGQYHKVLTSAWRAAGSSMYRIDSQFRSWSDFEGSYFGQTGSPTYIVGEAAPSKEWTLFSQVPLE